MAHETELSTVPCSCHLAVALVSPSISVFVPWIMPVWHAKVSQNIQINVIFRVFVIFFREFLLWYVWAKEIGLSV